MKRGFLALTVALALTGIAAAEDVDFQALLVKVDEQTNFKNIDLSARVTVVSRKPGEEDNVIQCQYFRRDAEDKFVILILKPEVNKGQGYLKIDDNIFFYDPESRKFSKYTGANNFQDSNAKNSDFQNSTLAGDYNLAESGREKLGAKDAWVLTLKAKRNDVTYPKRKIWVEVSTTLVLKSEDYSLSDRLMRTSLYGKYLQIQNRFVPQLMRFDDNLKKGEVTVLTLENPSLTKLPDTVFTQAYLEKVNN